MARIRTTQANLRGPINRDENLIAHSWYRVLVAGAIIGTIALLVWMFQAGAWSERHHWSRNDQWAPPPQATDVVPAPQEEIPPRRPASLEEKTNKFWDNTLRR